MWTAEIINTQITGTVRPEDKMDIEVHFTNSDNQDNFVKTYQISLRETGDENDVKALIESDLDLLEKTETIKQKINLLPKNERTK